MEVLVVVWGRGRVAVFVFGWWLFWFSRLGGHTPLTSLRSFAPLSLCERGRAGHRPAPTGVPPLSFGHFPLGFRSLWRGKACPLAAPFTLTLNPLLISPWEGEGKVARERGTAASCAPLDSGFRRNDVWWPE